MSEYDLLKEYEETKRLFEKLKMQITRIKKLHKIANNSGNKEEALKANEILEKLQEKIDKVRDSLSVL